MEILIILLLIILNGIFSMSEISLVSAKKYKLEALLKKGNKGALCAIQMAGNPNKFLSTVQIGITLIGVLTGIFGGQSLISSLSLFLSKISFLTNYSNFLGMFIVVFIITFFSIVFGELIPKKIGLLYPEKIACIFSRPMSLISKCAKPFIFLLSLTNDLFMKVFGINDTNNNNMVSEEEIKAMVQESANAGEIEKIEHSIVERVFSLGDKSVSKLMTNRKDIIWLDINSSEEEIKATIREELHSIYPVCNGSIDELIGIVNIKFLLSSYEKFDLQSHVSKPIFVPDNIPAYSMLEKFRNDGTHLAIVVDEYGSTAGLITLDDVLDALVGDMSEKHQDEYKITVRDENSWLADAQFSYSEMLDYFDIQEDEVYDEEHNTIAGLILDRLGKIPNVGDILIFNNLKIEVIDMDGMRIDKLLITRIN